jgi:hypothetical protein
MVTTSPFCACLTSEEKLVFASNIVAEIMATPILSVYLNQLAQRFQLSYTKMQKLVDRQKQQVSFRFAEIAS